MVYKWKKTETYNLKWQMVDMMMHNIPKLQNASTRLLYNIDMVLQQFKQGTVSAKTGKDLLSAMVNSFS